MKKNIALFLTLLLFIQSVTTKSIQADENDFTKSSSELISTTSSSEQETSQSDASSSITGQTVESNNATEPTVTEDRNAESEPSTETQESIQPQSSESVPLNNTYAIIQQKGKNLWDSIESIEENKKPENVWSDPYVGIGKIFNAVEEISIAEKTYYRLEDDTKSLSFYIEKEAVALQNEPWKLDDSFISLKYLTINSSKWTIYNDLNLSQHVSSQEILNKGYKVSARYNHINNKSYLELSDNTKKIGYIDEDEVINNLVDKPEITSYEKYVQVKDNKQAFKDLEKLASNSSFSTQELQKQTFFAKEIYQDKFIALYDNNETLKGYVNKTDVSEVDGKQGNYHEYNKYVTITSKNYAIWNDLNWNKKNMVSSIILNNTYKAKGIYHHFNGSNYLSIYDKNDQLQGYINEKAVKIGNGKQGGYRNYGKYVTITSKNYAIWNSFDWKNKNTVSSKIFNNTYQAKGIYHHFNGSNYLSIYDKNNKWQGYINEKAVKIGNGKQGGYRNYGKYVTITSKNYAIWNSFDWKNKNTVSSKIFNNTYQAKGIYYYFGGSNYLSIYDSHGKWIGYVNEKAVKIASGKQGIYHNFGKAVKVKTNGYAIWRNFSWSKKASGNHKGKIYTAKGIYHHMNGSSYLSLYNGNKWIGYINQKGTTSAKGVANYMGTSRQKLLNSLTKDEKASKKKKRYLGTPFGGFSVMNPQKYSNCTGFVALAIQDSGGKLNKITNVANAYGGPANAYNWRDALKKNTSYYTFNSVSQLLKSGKARKGDIIYFEADFSKPNPDCHIGFFWGNSSSDNRIWHSTVAGGGNNITHIFSGTPYTKIYLFPMD